MTVNSNLEEAEEIRWQPIVAKYAKPDLSRSLGQVANSILPYFVMWGLMIWSIQVSYWMTLALAPLAGGTFLVGVPFAQPIHRAPQDFWRFTEYGIRYLLRAFAIEQALPRFGT